MNKINEVISIKGKPDKTVSLYYTHHGPVTFIDKKEIRHMQCDVLG